MVRDNNFIETYWNSRKMAIQKGKEYIYNFKNNYILELKY